MKKILLSFLMALLAWPVMAQGAFPQVSNGSQEYWYYIQMQNGMGVLASQGEGKKLITAGALKAKGDQQLWKVEQTTTNHYRLTSRGGQVMYYNTSEGKFMTAANPQSGYQSFQIVKTTNSSYQGYEIYVDQVSGNNAYLNQWGGAGIGKELGLWSKGDPNNPMWFVAEAEMQFADVKPDAVSEVSITGTTTWKPEHTHTLWYTKPATVWMTSTLPIGNGQFGACVMGGVKRDEVQFNDKTLWWGHLGNVVANGSYGSYLDFGHLYITELDDNVTAATNYRRWLDIEEALAGVAYTANGTDYQREYLVSYPDRVLAIRYTASKGGQINKNLILFNANGVEPTYSVTADGKGVAVFSGEAKRTGTQNNEAFYCRMTVETKGGTISASEDYGLDVSGADELTIYLLGATNFSPDNDDYIYPASELPEKVEATVTAAVGKGYNAIRTDHLADYKALYDRCQLAITTQQNTVPTPTLINNFAKNNASNLLLEQLYFAYGRYLMIACSRGIDLPSNLQGIWNDSNSPAWNSDIHANINVQMNYWPAEITNLSELHMPFLNYIKREACDRSQWRKNAKQIAGQTKGWTLTTENNIYGSGSNWMQNYTIANAWYCMHLWQHYRYTLDVDYLRNVALPAMKSCCEYWLERLVLANDGTYECPNEYSPEQGPGSENATAHSQQLVWDLFNNTLQAYEVLNITNDGTFLNNLKQKFAKLDKGTATEVVDGLTLLREWKYTSQANYDYKNHRHMSHLMGLYPGNQIAEDIDPVIYAAARQSVLTRGYGSTGWSMGWKINLNARVRNAEGCHTIITNALKLTANTGNSQGGGIYENLWDAHTPYQIDGNFGACAGMAEMLMQSYTGKIDLLPALPAVWKQGSVKGLCAVNCFDVDIDWADGKVTTVVILSKAGEKAVVKYTDAAWCFDITDAKGNTVDYQVENDNEISFPTEVGGVYTLKHNGRSLYARCDDIEDGDYAIALPLDGETRYLQQQSSRSGQVGTTTEVTDKGTIWTIKGYDAASYPSYSSYKSWQKEGRVYFLYNKDYELAVKNKFIKTTAVDASSLHPIYVNQMTGLMAIRASNLDSSQNAYDGWYAYNDTKPTATETTPQYCWQLVDATTGIIPVQQFNNNSTVQQFNNSTSGVYDLQGREMKNELKTKNDNALPKGVYISKGKKVMIP